MTRKRFVKLMMARGYSRNAANDIAFIASGTLSYSQLFYVCTCDNIAETITEALRTVRQTILTFVDNLPKFIEDILQALPWR